MAVTAREHHQRPKVELISGEIRVHGCRAMVTFNEGVISVNCTDASPEALRKLLAAYDSWRANPDKYVYQVRG